MGVERVAGAHAQCARRSFIGTGIGTGDVGFVRSVSRGQLAKEFMPPVDDDDRLEPHGGGNESEHPSITSDVGDDELRRRRA